MNEIDPILRAHLEEQRRDLQALADRSDLFDFHPYPEAPNVFRIGFTCKGLVKAGDEISPFLDWKLRIVVPFDYLRKPDWSRMVTLLFPGPPLPLVAFHPNIFPGYQPPVCVGTHPPGTPLTQVVFQLHAIVTGQNVATHDTLNPEAAQYYRNHPERFPLETGPLCRPADEDSSEEG